MAQQTINIGTGPDDNTGDHLRSAFTKVNENFEEMYEFATTGSPLTTKGDLYGYSTENVRVPVGTDNYVLTADSTAGSGLSWQVAPTTVANDASPVLGGNLTVGAFSIVSAGGLDIAITPDTTGSIILDGLSWPQADGTADYVLKTDGGGNLSWVAQNTLSEVNDLSAAVTWANVPDGNITETSVTQHKVAVIKTDYNAQIIGYTAILSDAEKMITMSLGTPITFTIPINSSVAYPVGTKLNVMQLGTGATTIAIDTGTDTLDVNANFTLVLNGQYAVATALKVTSTSWVLFGNLVAV